MTYEDKSNIILKSLGIVVLMNGVAGNATNLLKAAILAEIVLSSNDAQAGSVSA